MCVHVRAPTGMEGSFGGDTRVGLSCKVLHLCTEMSECLDEPTRKAHSTLT